MRVLLTLGFLLFLGACVPTAVVDDDDDSASEEGACLPVAGGWATDPDGESGQIHPRTILAGDALWTVYNRPDGGSDFAVYVVVRGCDGSLLAGPVRLDDGSGNATDPDLAVSGDRVLVAWQNDDRSSPWNLSVRTAVIDLEGTVLQEDRRLEMTDGGTPWAGNAWMAHPAATPDGFLLVLSRANTDSVVFGLALQPLDTEGAVQGDALFMGTPDSPRFEASIAVDAGGGAWLSYLEDLSGQGPAALLRVEPQGEEAESVSWPLLDTASAGAVLAHEGDTLWGVSSQAASAIQLGNLGGEMLRADVAGGGLRLAPGLSVGVDGGVVAWAQGTPANASIHVRAFGASGWSSDAIEVSAGPAAAYPADVVRLDQEHVLVTWAMGTSPDFLLWSEVVALP